MMRRVMIATTLCCLIFPMTALAKDRFLQGRVLLVGEQDELKPVIGQDVVVVESGDAARTKDGGRFRIFLKDVFKPGTRITLSVEKKGWRIQYPLDGETRVPDDLDKELVDVRLLPDGSKKFWSADRIEKFIRDTADKSKEQIRPEGRPEEIDFSRYIKEWAIKYGFSAQQAKGEIDKWVAESEQKNDPYQLGLAAYAKKNFSEAGKLFEESAVVKSRRAHETSALAQRLTEEAIRDFQLAGAAHINNYRFDQALLTYQRARELTSQGDNPRLWADLTVRIGITESELGVRTEGNNIHHHLRNAAAAFRAALMVYTKESLPQDWAAMQTNLANVLQEQGTRTGGEDSTRLLARAVNAYHEALKVYTKDAFPQQWAATQNNLGLVLQEQGIHAGGKKGTQLLAQAVTAYHKALTVYTKDSFPQQWATTQNSLGIVLRNQGIRTGGEAGTQLFAEAVAAYCEALKVRTKDLLPQQWAATQNNLGLALGDQGTRTGGKAGTQLLAQAVAAYREALTVRTKDSLPQQWAATQNNLGIVLQEQGTRTSGKEGIALLAQAVAAYREALTVYTKEALPQQWAMTQNNLGNMLRDQGIRTGGEEGTRLLAQAVAAYREALEIRTREHLPTDWAQTHGNLAKAALLLEDWPTAVESYRNALTLYPGYYEAYLAANGVYHDKLFAYPSAFEITKQWLDRHPEDMPAQANFAEAHLTTRRYEEATRRLGKLLEKSDLGPHFGVGLRIIDIVTTLALKKANTVPQKLQELRTFVLSQPETFHTDWSFDGTTHFVQTEQVFAPYHLWLIELFTIVKSNDRAALLSALERVQASFQP